MMNVTVKKLRDDADVAMLLWVGCMGALYDQRSKNTIISAVKILQKADINFGVLGNEERCCGDPARRIGNEYLFQQLARENLSILERYKVKKVVTLCPHCFNALGREYQRLGADFEVQHFAQFLSDLLKEGRISIERKLDGQFTYHDPCYLGRYNGIYDAPRQVMEHVLAGHVREMPFSRSDSFCCGAGGGSFWRGEVRGERIEILRVQQAASTEVDGIVTACPFCEILFRSAAGESNSQYLKVWDLAELVDKAME